MLIFLKSFFLLSALLAVSFFTSLMFWAEFETRATKNVRILTGDTLCFLQRNFAAASTADDAKYQVRVYVFRFVVLWSRRVIERWFPLLAFLFLLALPLSLSF